MIIYMWSTGMSRTLCCRAAWSSQSRPATGYVFSFIFSFKKSGTPKTTGNRHNKNMTIDSMVSGISPPSLSIMVPTNIPQIIDPAHSFIKNQLNLIPFLHFMQDQLIQSGEGKTNKYHKRIAFLWQCGHSIDFIFQHFMNRHSQCT